MSEIIKLFQNLSKFYNSETEFLSFDKIDEIYENCEVEEKISCVKVATENTLVLSNLLELSTALRNIRECTDNGYDNSYDCWDRVIEVSPKNGYLEFVYSLVGLANYNPKEKTYRKLSLAAVSTYFLSLTIPGSKGFHIFDEKIISHCLKVLQLIETLQSAQSLITGNQNRVEIWVSFMNLFDDLKIMFRYVHFDKYKEARNSIISDLTKILYFNHQNGFENNYSANLHSKCFEIFDEIINAHNGDPEETLMKIMKIGFILHTHSNVSKLSKYHPAAQIPSSNPQFCSHISDWFVESTISKYPRILKKVLNFYITSVITNPDKSWRVEQQQKALDYAAKYDSQLYIKCNESILNELSTMLKAEDSQIRLNALELLNRILLIDSTVNWELFRHEISNIPREVYAIKEVIIKISDINNNIKLKALHGIQLALNKGNQNTKKIITEGIQFSNFDGAGIILPIEPRVRKKEIRFPRPIPLQPGYTYEGYEIVQTYFNNLPNQIYNLWRHNPIGYIRKAAVSLIESIVILNPLVIYNTDFVKRTIALSNDPNSLVRKQSLQMIDNTLNKYPNCYPVIYTWCCIIAPLFTDNESRNIQLAWECFKHRVFDNIKGIDQSNNAENFTPWIIIRVLLSTHNRQFLQLCINEAAKKSILDKNVLKYIESHTLTSNSTEAWILLNFIPGKINYKEPDSLMSAFIKLVSEQSWNVGQNLQVVLEVLSKCIKDFSHSALNMAFTSTINLIKKGLIPPAIMSKVFDFCLTINMQSEKNSSKKSSTSNDDKRCEKKWINDIHTICESYIEENYRVFYSNKARFMSYLFSYSEANLELSKRPKNNIIYFIHNSIREHINIPESEFDSEDVNTLNQFIILSTRFSIRDSLVASQSCELFSLILKKIDRPQIINTVLVAITDLCKRHTQTVELTLNHILKKLQSPYLENRQETFKNIAILIMQDQLKLRGNILLYMIATMLDDNDELSNIAVDFFYTYIETKNSTLFQSCLLEFPFACNEFMNFDGFESFTEIEVISPLKGPDMIKSRQQLYDTFIFEIDEVNLLLYFDNLKIIYGKIQNDPSIKSEEGYAMVKDLLYIFKQICNSIVEKKKSKTDSTENSSLTTSSVDIAEEEMVTAAAGETTAKKIKGRVYTKIDAMLIVEKSICFIPKISKILLEWDSSTFKDLIDDLSISVARKFDEIVKYAQPADFWNTYGNDNKRKNDSIECNEVPETTEKKIRKVSDLPTTILFHPFSKI